MIKLAVLDLDGTLTAHHSVWQCIHERLGTWGRGEVHLHDYLAGKIDYAEFARMDAAEWKGVPLKKIQEIVNDIPIVDGAKELIQDLKHLGVKTVIISSGLDILAERVAKTLRIDDHFSNKLKVDQDGKLSGEVEVIVPADRKGEFFKRLLQERNVATVETIAIGDGLSDIPLFKISGTSFAVNASEEVGVEATYHVKDFRKLWAKLKTVIYTGGGTLP